MNKIENKLYTFDDKTNDEVLLMNGFTHINHLIPYVNDLQRENKQLKDNWNKLKDYIVKEYYMYLPLEASTNSITILIDKMHELEGSDSNE